MPKLQDITTLGTTIPAFFLLLLVLQLLFMPSFLGREGQLYVPFKKVVVGGNANNPPYEYLDENNEPAGYIVELTRALAAEMKIEVEIMLSGREELEKNFKDGSIDLIQGVTNDPNGPQEHPFFNLMSYRQTLFSRIDFPDQLNSLQQIHGGTLAASKNTPFLSRISASNPSLIIKTVASHSEALRQLASAEVDYALIVNLPSPYLERELEFIKHNGDGEAIFQIGELTHSPDYGYMLRSRDADLFGNLQNGLNHLITSGRHDEIQQQWLGRLDQPRISMREKSVHLGGLIFSPLLLVACTVYFWNGSLRREVDRRSREIAMQQSQLVQADKLTSLGILVAGVAHEINNPTALILHNLSTLKRIYDVSTVTLEERFDQEGDFFVGGMRYSMLREESSHVFEEMKDGAYKITQIVEDLKDFSRKDQLDQIEHIDLNDVVNSALRLLDGSLRKQLCDVRLDLDYNKLSFEGNKSRIQQVIVNLILNACQASETYESVIDIRTFSQWQTNEVVLRIKDRGIGIEAEKLPFICDPFYTTKIEQGGTGLGLSISDTIVKEHKGRLNFDSVVGAGTLVSLHLPAFTEKKT